MTQKLNLSPKQEALTGLEPQVRCVEPIEHQAQPLQVLVECLAENDDVIQVDETHLPLQTT